MQFERSAVWSWPWVVWLGCTGAPSAPGACDAPGACGASGACGMLSARSTLGAFGAFGTLSARGMFGARGMLGIRNVPGAPDTFGLSGAFGTSGIVGIFVIVARCQARTSPFITSRDNLTHMEKRLAITHFTDPLCFWCYAMEPEIRKIRVLLDEQLDYHIVMGVLSANVHDYIGYDAETELRYELFRARMAEYLTQAANTIGMPFSPDRLTTSRPEEFVSLPLCLAYCAMRLIDETIAEAYLRRMRECVYAEGRSLSSIDAQVELAKEFPVDIEQFRDNLENGAAASILQEGVDECKAYSVTAFPTLLLQYGEIKVAMRGYFDYAALRQTIAQLTDGDASLTDAEFSMNALESYIDRFGKAAAREIQTMFSLNDAQLANAMMDLVSTGLYKTESCGSSYFVMHK